MSIRAEIIYVGRVAHDPRDPDDSDWGFYDWHTGDSVGIKFLIDNENCKLAGWPFRELLILSELSRIAGQETALSLAKVLRDRDEVTHNGMQDKIKDLQRQIDELKEEAR